jgi:uncharacterized membrane protein (GlpM family)
MRFAIKLLLSLSVILLCTQLGRKWPALAGLIAMMPLIGPLVLIGLYVDNPGNSNLMALYCEGALFGLIPTALFYATALVCFHKRANLWVVLCAGFSIWLLAAVIHQLLLRKPH